MKSKTLITVALLVFVLGSATFLIAKESRQGPETDPEKSLRQSSHKVVTYYFHGRARCSSCRKIEAYTREAILSGFADAIRDGRLEWLAVNIEEHGNEHFIKDFKLYTKSVVIVDTRNGEQIRWKNLKKVWELLYDKDAFLKYIRDEVGSYLAEN
ncbi:MAG: nitrophenyl compound nitroreductase subunit ArsF family protein [Pseudomonadota bacterium]